MSPDDPPETLALLDAVRAGDAAALDSLLTAHRPYLRRLVGLRIDPRLQPRLDESDIVQDACLAAARRLPDYQERRPVPFRLWLRQIALDCLADQWRAHLGADCRAVGREAHLSGASTAALARRLLADDPSPGGEVRRKERAELVRTAIENLAPDDREIILLRTVEELSNAEAAAVLGVRPAAASKRLLRAMQRLRAQFVALGLSESSR